MSEENNSQDLGPQWETKRQKILGMLEVCGVLDLEILKTELEYMSKSSLLEDINSLAKTIEQKGMQLLVDPSWCINCGFKFEVSKKGLRIPSKCPKCKQQRIAWPKICLQK
jgi:predicted Zn-ribbon and HTH transcriptional regulator